MGNSQVLQKRLQACLESVLETEENLRKKGHKGFLRKEFFILKSYVNKIHSIELSEEEIIRLESLTEEILFEAKKIEKPLIH